MSVWASLRCCIITIVNNYLILYHANVRLYKDKYKESCYYKLYTNLPFGNALFIDQSKRIQWAGDVVCFWTIRTDKLTYHPTVKVMKLFTNNIYLSKYRKWSNFIFYWLLAQFMSPIGSLCTRLFFLCATLYLFPNTKVVRLHVILEPLMLQCFLVS